jgi:hypothetical protein
MYFLGRRRLLRRALAALEKLASNVGLIREAGKEFRLFSHEASHSMITVNGCCQRRLPLPRIQPCLLPVPLAWPPPSWALLILHVPAFLAAGSHPRAAAGREPAAAHRHA